MGASWPAAPTAPSPSALTAQSLTEFRVRLHHPPWRALRRLRLPCSPCSPWASRGSPGAPAARAATRPHSAHGPGSVRSGHDTGVAVVDIAAPGSPASLEIPVKAGRRRASPGLPEVLDLGWRDGTATVRAQLRPRSASGRRPRLTRAPAPSWSLQRATGGHWAATSAAAASPSSSRARCRAGTRGGAVRRL